MELMPSGQSLAIPLLNEVPATYRVFDGLDLVTRTAIGLLKAGLATEEDWVGAGGDPAVFVQRFLERWVKENGGDEISKVFGLHLSLTTMLDHYGRQPEQEEKLYLVLEPESAGYIVLGPAMRLLEAVHPRLPVTFVHTFTGALNRWVRVYDWRDALARVERIREWHEMDPEGEDYALSDIGRAIPDYMRRRPLSNRALRRLAPTIRKSRARELVRALLDLAESAEKGKRPMISESASELLSDCGDPVPALLAVFEEHDAIEGQFDEESQGMLEVTPEPNFVIELTREPPDLMTAFGSLAACCALLRIASAIVTLAKGKRD